MFRLRSSLAASRVLFLVALVCTGSCATTGKDSQTVLLPSGRLAAQQPADIAVLPVRNQSGTAGVPLDTLRQGIYEGLVERLYSPLELEYVDRNWREASLGSATPADAVLSLSILRWDASFLEPRGVLIIEGEARLLPSADPGGTPLWGVTLTRRLDVAAAGDAWRERAAELFAAAILANLPERDPYAAPR